MLPSRNTKPRTQAVAALGAVAVILGVTGCIAHVDPDYPAEPTTYEYSYPGYSYHPYYHSHYYYRGYERPYYRGYYHGGYPNQYYRAERGEHHEHEEHEHHHR